MRNDGVHIGDAWGFLSLGEPRELRSLVAIGDAWGFISLGEPRELRSLVAIGDDWGFIFLGETRELRSLVAIGDAWGFIFLGGASRATLARRHWRRLASCARSQLSAAARPPASHESRARDARFGGTRICYYVKLM